MRGLCGAALCGTLLFAVRHAAVADAPTTGEGLRGFERLRESAPFGGSAGHRILVFSRTMKTGSSSLLQTLQNAPRYNASAVPVFVSHSTRRGARGYNVQVCNRALALPAGVSRVGEGAAAVGAFLASRRFGDVWLESHLTSFGAGHVAPFGRVVHYVTVARSPLDWLRSMHQHRAQSRANFSAYLVDDGFHGASHELATHYSLALPPQVREALSRARGPRGAVVDLDGVRDHLRDRYVVLVFEFMDLSLDVLSVALTGRRGDLRPSHALVKSDASLGAAGLALDAGTLRGFAPRLAPYEAVYGLMAAQFFASVERAGLAPPNNAPPPNRAPRPRPPRRGVA